MRLPKNIELLPKYIVEDVHKRVGSAIAKDMINTYRSIIYDFYNDYRPKVYKRKYRMYFFAHKSGVNGTQSRATSKFIDKHKDNKGFTVRMNITSDNITTDYTSITGNMYGKRLNDLVFYNTFVEGKHGGRLPLWILPEEQQSIISQYGMRNWTCYRDIGWAWTPPVTKPSPLERMDEWFYNYTKGGEMQKTVDKVIIHSIETILKQYNKKYK